MPDTSLQRTCSGHLEIGFYCFNINLGLHLVLGYAILSKGKNHFDIILP